MTACRAGPIWGPLFFSSSSYLRSSLLLKGSGNSWLHSKSFSDKQSLPRPEESPATTTPGSSLPPFWKAAVEASCVVLLASCLYCPTLLPLGISYQWWRSPWHNQLQDTQMCLHNVTLQCSVSLWEGTKTSPSRTTCSKPLLISCFTPWLLLNFLENRPPHNISSTFAFRLLLHDFADYFLNM